MLIELRLGPGRFKIARMVSDVTNSCALPRSRTHRVPHISLYTPCPRGLHQTRGVREALAKACEPYAYLPYRVDGFQRMHGEQGEVVYLRIVPSQELQDFRTELIDRLKMVCPSGSTSDSQEQFVFHITIGYKLSHDQAERVWSHVSDTVPATSALPWYRRLLSIFWGPSVTSEHGHPSRLASPYLPLDALRVTLLGDDQRILCEYDLASRRMLDRRRALDKSVWRETLRDYRIRRGMQDYSHPAHGQVFLISDLHLDHANIIDYCARPFTTVGEMNQTLVMNWNETVHDRQVYCLGDLSFGRGARPNRYWLPLLSGDKHYVRGNHEGTDCGSPRLEELHCGGLRFLLAHDPKRLPEEYRDWDGWTIHGHIHNNEMREYPFINGERRTINVSAELVNYRPVSMEYLLSLGLDRVKRMDTVDSPPDYW